MTQNNTTPNCKGTPYIPMNKFRGFIAKHPSLPAISRRPPECFSRSVGRLVSSSAEGRRFLCKFIKRFETGRVFALLFRHDTSYSLLPRVPPPMREITCRSALRSRVPPAPRCKGPVLRPETSRRLRFPFPCRAVLVVFVLFPGESLFVYSFSGNAGSHRHRERLPKIGSFIF